MSGNRVWRKLPCPKDRAVARLESCGLRRGRLTVAVALGVAWMIASQGVALAAAGDLDPSFDTNGKRVIESRDAVSWVGLVQPNARIVLVGWQLDHERTIVARLRPNGALDQSFEGKVLTPWMKQGSGSGGCATDLALMPDGRLVTAAEQTSLATDHMAVARYLAA